MTLPTTLTEHAASGPAVVGEGYLAHHLANRFAVAPVPPPPTRGQQDITVLVAELGELGDYQDTMVESLVMGRRLLFVGTWRSLAYLGPLWTPGTQGCPRCLVTRTANTPFGPGLDGDDLAESLPHAPDVRTWGPGVLGIIEHYVRALLSQDTARGDTATGRQVVVVDGTAGSVEHQPLLADSTCPGCGAISTDTLPELTPRGVPVTKPDPAVLRTGRLDLDHLCRQLLFPGLGLFKEVRQDLQSPFGACSVELPSRWGRREPAIGRARDYRSSRAIAVLEGLERYAGLQRGGRAAPVRASYTEVADRALYPPSLGTHPPESHQLEGFRYQEFHPDTVVDWVQAYSFQQDGPVLVPERAAFWGPRHDAEVSFFYDTSNGCALGSCTEEAVLHGLRELAERDAFLLTWYRRLALPEVQLEGADPQLDQLLAKSELFTGFRFRCFNATMEYGMPAYVLTAENSREDGPRTFAGGGAHPDPVQAVTGGLYELVGTILATRDSYRRNRGAALRMLTEPDLMRRMEDHSAVGALPEARDRYAFLLDRPATAGGRLPLAEIPGTLRSDQDDLRADLHTALTGVLDQGMDVLVVDQTMPELRHHGVCCVRVLVPGLLPMTFGYRNRRTAQLPRLTEGTSLPYTAQPDPDAPIGAIPHPFP
ncbi:TOMM precursor leader peptide-binding protein [Streptomyces verrucosisporus]|uniref:TOMM precursor leader peptide-binding protein n=1 Tax=Streptomyces verrucosisporus TaxID=1695161 RepID=UPI0019D0B6FB|nr:TOMM precursor leader peptide-binding protein [Streptomyces verrucosisporus]MBN3932624.1 TOMM precursor leader peptide-binding protein [Streptomyces verrucosisporus]